MSNSAGMVIQDRDLHLLRELGVMRILDREQAKVVAGFGSTTRANARLLALVRAGLLDRFFLGTIAGGAKALYSLSAKGAQLAEVPHRGFRRTKDQALVADFSVQHQLATNQVYCALKYGTPPIPNVCFQRWLTFQEPIHQGLRLIPDGYAEFQTPAETVAAFLEVDLGHERLKVWKEKVENYFQLARSGDFERRFRASRFRTLVVVHTVGRMLSIRSAIAAMTERIFWFSTLGAIETEGAFAPIWLRPRNDDRQPLFRAIP